jgi:hypothetical protein
MSSRIAELVEQVFAEQGWENDFQRYPVDWPFSIVWPNDAATKVIYSTKPRVVIAGFGAAFASGVPIIGRYGLPRNDDVIWICRLIGGREVLFVGDLDPIDLLTYSWMKDRFPDVALHYKGVSDGFLAELDVVLPDSYTIQLSKAESDALPAVETAIGDLSAAVGPNCAAMLRQARKIELEAVVSASRQAGTAY